MISFLFSPSHMPTCRMQWFFFRRKSHPCISQPSTTRPPFCKMCLDLKTHQSLVPALDYPACSQLEGQWLTPEQKWNKPS